MSRVNYGAKPIMLPQPVLIIGTYDEAHCQSVASAMMTIYRLDNCYRNM